ncbi:hypothetical protein ACFX19_015637 [Malus domestica]
MKLSNMVGSVAAVDADPFATILLVFFSSPRREEIVVIHEAVLESKECFSFPLKAPHHSFRRNIFESKGKGRVDSTLQ